MIGELKLIVSSLVILFILNFEKFKIGCQCESFISINKFVSTNNSTAILVNWFSALDYIFIPIFFARPSKSVFTACYIYWSIHYKISQVSEACDFVLSKSQLSVEKND